MSEPTRDKVFISYSHKDKKWLQELKTMLKPLITINKILPWDDSKIRTGEKWHDEITKALDSAKISVLLVRKHFLASDYITKKELPVLSEAAQKKQCTIFWLLLSECLYEE